MAIETQSQSLNSKSTRLLSLDIFRGLTIATMITVNEPGIEKYAYAPLIHAHWNGITLADFVFPSFVFMVGVSIALSYSKQLVNHVPRKQMIGKIFRRAITLYVIGTFLSIVPLFNLATIRYTGVLQRISIAYVASSLLYLYTNWKTQVKLAVFVLVAYCIAMTLIPVPGYGYPILEPGKNLAAWIDSLYLPGRMWQGTWDPESILSTFPAIVTGITGLLIGQLIISKQTAERKIIWLFLAGFLSFVVANIWNLFFPINKNIWSSSFVLYTSGTATMILATLYFIVDVLGYRKWASFFKIYGSNAIAAYLIADLSSDFLFFKWGGPQGTSINMAVINAITPSNIPLEIISLTWAVSFCLLCFIPIYIFYRKKIFLKI